MNKKPKHILILSIGLILLLLVAGCTGTSNSSKYIDANSGEHIKTSWGEFTSGGTNLEKITIPEDNVTCYITQTGYAKGISCLRDEKVP